MPEWNTFMYWLGWFLILFAVAALIHDGIESWGEGRK